MASLPEHEDGGMNIIGMRRMLQQAEQSWLDCAGPPNDTIDEFYILIPTPAGHELEAKVWRHKNTPAPERPLVLLFHGGGFAAGSKEMCTRPGREFAKDFEAVVVSASYRLCPDHAWPAPVQGKSI